MKDYWLGTVSGKKIDLLSPDPDQITLEDIAHALSRVQRFNGHTEQHWSVMQHSMAVANLVRDEDKAQALLHDATEAYICDIPSPLKHLLGDVYRDVEKRLAAAIGTKFGIDLINLPLSVKRADAIMLMTEHDHMQHRGAPWETDFADGMRCHADYYSPNNPTTFINVVRRSLTFVPHD